MYRTAVLRKFIEEENDLRMFFKSFTLLDAIYKCCFAWERVKKKTLIRSWIKILLDILEEEDEEFCGFSEEVVTAAQIAKTREWCTRRESGRRKRKRMVL